MILVTRLNGKQYYLNAELVKTVEATPDTVITLTSQEKVLVKEPAETVIARLVHYQQQIRAGGQVDQPASVAGDDGAGRS